MERNEAPLYFVWGIDQVAYGPVELPTLVTWIRDERIERDTWIHDQRAGKWVQAKDLSELRLVLGRRNPATTAPGDATGAIKPGSLRRIKILAELTDEHLVSFARYMECQRVPQFATVVTAGEAGDSMFMLLEGELRVRVLVQGKESILATLEPGESFGELALLDEGKRSGLRKLFEEAPALAAPFLYALGRTTAGRLRATNRRVEDSIRLSRSTQ